MIQEHRANARTNIPMCLEINKSNLTNWQIANKLGISEPTVRKMEK